MKHLQIQKPFPIKKNIQKPFTKIHIVSLADIKERLLIMLATLILKEIFPIFLPGSTFFASPMEVNPLFVTNIEIDEFHLYIFHY